MSALSTAVASTSTDSVRRAGLACFAAGTLGAGSGLFLVFVDPAVPDTQFSYPLTASGFIAIQVWFMVQHLGLLLGQLGLRSVGVSGPGRPSAIGHVVAIGGMLILTCTEGLAVMAADSAYPSSRTDVLDVLYTVATVAIGVGFILVGRAVARERRWTGWRRWIVLALGVWVFVPMIPAIIAGFLSARLAISGWMLLYAALGWALAQHHANSVERS